MFGQLVIKLYYFAVNEKRVDKIRKIDRKLRKIGGRFYVKTLGQLKYRLRYNKVLCERNEISSEIFWNCEKKIIHSNQPLVSILVPFSEDELAQRDILNDIYKQEYPNIEVLFIPGEYSEHLLSWMKKALAMAKGELIWVIDGKCRYGRTFLCDMVSLFSCESVMMGTCLDLLINNVGGCVPQNESGDTPFFMSATNFVRELSVNPYCFLPIGAMVFKNTNRVFPDMEFNPNIQTSASLLWILNIIRGGTVGFIQKKNVLLPEMQEMKYNPEELAYLLCFIASNYRIKPSLAFEKSAADTGIKIEELQKTGKEKHPNIILTCHALRLGGGETYPIHLANEMYKRGLTVTILNFDLQPRETEIVDLIDGGIPVINLRHTDDIGKVLQDVGADIIHSHEAVTDYSISLWIARHPELGRHIVTLHGMYEAMDKEDCDRTICETIKSVYKYVYIADKNLDCFKKRNLYKESKFIKISNGLPAVKPTPVNREELGIPEDDFVLVLASRGIPGKGWEEAITAVKKANQISRRKIRLVILGDGEIRQKLEETAPEFIHFMGTVRNVRDYFAMAEAGILPSTYKGESYPIVVMECLMTGRPIIVTDIGETSNQISDCEGNQAGLLIPLHHGEVIIDDICEAILRLVNEKELYTKLRKNTASVSKKFDLKDIVDQYIALYSAAITS